jgi:hypothetical protein
MSATIDWPAVEAIVHRDPMRRGLAGYRREGEALDAGQWPAAAGTLAGEARHVGIATGFCVRGPRGWTAETDGPPGAIALARALELIGCRVTFVTDALAAPILNAGCQHARLAATLVEMPIARHDAAATGQWIEAFLQRMTDESWSHLVAIERPGRSHAPASIAEQAGDERALADFLARTTAEHFDACHNMRGEIIDEHTAPLDLLFDQVRTRQLPLTTIGIGDGGNEIGLGRYAWRVLVEAIGTAQAPRIVTRIAADFALLAGVSNWGGHALALAIAHLRERRADFAWTPDAEAELVGRLVEAGAVDGVTRRAEAMVDGLPLDDYLAPLIALRELFGCGNDST